MTEQITIWFDSNCPVCRYDIAWLKPLDRRGAIRVVKSFNPQTVCPIDRGDILARFHAQEGERLLSGAAAIAAMWRAIPLLRPLAQLAGLPAVTPVFEAAYRGFLRLRPRLQRLFR